MVPDGFDLFRNPWTFPEAQSHPLYETFLAEASRAGFNVESEGFRDSEAGYFLFFLLGRGDPAVSPSAARRI